MEKVLIREVGLRDGLQLVKNIPTEKKIEWLNMQAFLNFKKSKLPLLYLKKLYLNFLILKKFCKLQKVFLD